MTYESGLSLQMRSGGVTHSRPVRLFHSTSPNCRAALLPRIWGITAVLPVHRSRSARLPRGGMAPLPVLKAKPASLALARLRKLTPCCPNGSSEPPPSSSPIRHQSNPSSALLFPVSKARAKAASKTTFACKEVEIACCWMLANRAFPIKAWIPTSLNYLRLALPQSNVHLQKPRSPTNSTVERKFVDPVGACIPPTKIEFLRRWYASPC